MTKKSATKSVVSNIFVGIAVALMALGVIIAVPLTVALCWALEIAAWGGLALLVFNVLLPLFDVHYELTITQAAAAGALTIIVSTLYRAIVGRKSS